MNENIIYLDYAASTPMSGEVIEAMKPYYQEKFYNPSAMYLAARAVKQDINNARSEIAQIIGAKSSEIIFTAGATEANNLAVNGVIGGASAELGSVELLVSAIEHDSILAPATKLGAKIVEVMPEGIVDIASVASQITSNTVLVSVMLANNEIGTIQPISEIAKIIKSERLKRLDCGNKLPIYLHTDAAQATNYLDLHVNKLGVDLMSVNGGKIYGPKQTGFLYVKTGTKVSPQILGGGQERGFRSGTENVAGIIGLAKAFKMVDGGRKVEAERQKLLQQKLLEELSKYNDRIKINGSLKHRLPNNVHITIDGIDNERVMMELDEQGVICAVGSACSASSYEPSHVLRAIGLSDAQARSSLRFTFGKQTTELMIEKTVKLLKDICL